MVILCGTTITVAGTEKVLLLGLLLFDLLLVATRGRHTSRRRLFLVGFVFTLLRPQSHV